MAELYLLSMRRTTFAVVAVIITASLPGCANLWSGRDPRPVPGPTRPWSAVPGAAVPSIPKTAREVEGENSGPSRKVVKGKEPESTLIAHDGTRCQVTEKRYRETVIGEKAWCAWR